MAEMIEETMRGFGYVVSRNKPYAGGFITEHYGNPAAGLHAIQLEINRALYMDERRYRALGLVRAPGERTRDSGGAPRRDPAGGIAALSGGGRIGLGRAAGRAVTRKKKGRSRLRAAQV